MSQTTLTRYARIGLWALPIYGLANLIGTLSSQPDYHKAANFPAYARYIHTPSFLASHLTASVLWAGIGLLGFTALLSGLLDEAIARHREIQLPDDPVPPEARLLRRP